jgi:hypothetical protein
MVRSRFLTPEHLIDALRNGDFYSSTGVSVESIETSDESLSIRIRPEDGVTYRTQFIGTRKGYAPSSEPVMGREPAGKIADITDRWVFVQAVADRASGKQILRVYDEENEHWHEASVDLPDGETNPSGPLYLPSHPNGYPYKGAMKQVRLWHRSRTRSASRSWLEQSTRYP